MLADLDPVLADQRTHCSEVTDMTRPGQSMGIDPRVARSRAGCLTTGLTGRVDRQAGACEGLNCQSCLTPKPSRVTEATVGYGPPDFSEKTQTEVVQARHTITRFVCLLVA